jgi:predicted nucleotidyltransferase
MLTVNDSLEVGLKPTDFEKIQELFKSYSEIEKVIVYGSRAKGNYKTYSDIDLTFVGEKINLSIQNKIENDLDDLLLPYKFDISNFSNIKNVDLINHINRVGKLIYIKKNS